MRSIICVTTQCYSLALQVLVTAMVHAGYVCTYVQSYNISYICGEGRRINIPDSM